MFSVITKKLMVNLSFPLACANIGGGGSPLVCLRQQPLVVTRPDCADVLFRLQLSMHSHCLQVPLLAP